MYFDGMDSRPRRRVPDWVWIVLLVGSMLLVGAWSWIK